MKKKILLLTVLCMCLCLSVSAYAAVTETEVPGMSPDSFWNGGVSYTSGSTPIDPGTLPVIEKGYLSASGKNPNVRWRFLGSGSAGPESAGSTNIVFKASGTEATFSDNEVPTTTSVVRHSAKFKLSSTAAGPTLKMFVVYSAYPYWTANHPSGIIISEGGAYIKKIVSIDANNTATHENVWFIPQNTLQTNTWYRAETVVDIVAERYIMQDARIYDENGALVARSGWYHVSNAKKSNDTGKYNAVQIQASNFGTDSAMIDEWSMYSVSGTEKATLTFDADTANRKVYKFVSSLPIDGTGITDESAVLVCENPRLDLTGKYTVSFDNSANTIVVTTDESLPFGESYTLKLKTDKLISNPDNYLAFDYSNADIQAAMSQTFTTGVDPFAVDSVSFGSDNRATVVMDNGDSSARKYLIVVSSLDANGKYLQTECTTGTVSAGATDYNVTAPAVTAVPGGKIRVIVWDDWQNMNCIGARYEHQVPSL